MINLKLSKSSGSGNSVPHVFGRLSSFMSEKTKRDTRLRENKQAGGTRRDNAAPAARVRTFCDPQLCRGRLFLSASLG